MKTKDVTKLWQGKYVSVRDYEVREAIRKGGLEINHAGKRMVVSPEELKRLTPNSKIIQSKFKGTYKLVDIYFDPLTDDPRQQKLNLN